MSLLHRPVLATFDKHKTDLTNRGACICIVDDYDYKRVKCIDIDMPEKNKFIYRNWDNIFIIPNDNEHHRNIQNKNTNHNGYDYTNNYNQGDNILALYPQTTTYYSATIKYISNECITVQFVDENKQHMVPKHKTFKLFTKSYTLPTIFAFILSRDKYIKKQAINDFEMDLKKRKAEKRQKDKKYQLTPEYECEHSASAVELNISSPPIRSPLPQRKATKRRYCMDIDLRGMDPLSQIPSCDYRINLEENSNNINNKTENDCIAVACKICECSVDIICNNSIIIKEYDVKLNEKKCVLIQTLDNNVKNKDPTQKRCEKNHVVGVFGVREYKRSTFYFCDDVIVID